MRNRTLGAYILVIFVFAYAIIRYWGRSVL